jgi:hypothetical protein
MKSHDEDSIQGFLFLSTVVFTSRLLSLKPSSSKHMSLAKLLPFLLKVCPDDWREHGEMHLTKEYVDRDDK